MPSKRKSVFLVIQLISLSRALCGLLFVCIALRQELHTIATILFVYACFSDMLDGYLARKYKCTSQPGQVLDLFGDKFLTIISTMYGLAKGMPIIPIAVIVFREVFLLAIRSLNTEKTKLFKPERLLGALTVFPIWLTTLLLLQQPHIITLDLYYFKLFYWMCGGISLLNLIYKLSKNWKALIHAFKSSI